MFDKLFNPGSVAIIGASQKELSIGNVITKNLLKYNFKGPIYPVNPKADEIRGVKAYPSILDIPGEVDLAHLSIPAVYAPAAMEECGKKGVKFVIINSAGFKEVGDEGKKLEQQVVQKAGEFGIRIFGPNCQGIINTDPKIQAYCNFTFTYPKPGNISIVAQSGGVGALFMQSIHDLGVGMRLYASNGNACDISIPEILEYYGRDEKTKVIILYVEGFSDPAEFLRVTKEVSKIKPILAMRSGRTEEGAKAALSHTGGLAGAGISTELIFKKAGILYFKDQEEMCQASMAFAMQPIPGGNKVGLITDTGGPAIIATDQLVDSGLEIPPLSKSAVEILEVKLYPEASKNNPIDVLATADAHHYRTALDVLLDEPDIDSIYINFVTPPFADTESIAREMAEVSKLKRKPVICNYMTDKPQFTSTTAIMKEGEIPCYDFPEMAAKVTAALSKYNDIRSRETGIPMNFNDMNKARADTIFMQAQNEGQKIISSDKVYRILESYNIPAAKSRIVNNAADALIAAGEIGFPVTIKAESGEIIHKSDVGGVFLNLKSREAVQSAVAKIESEFKKVSLKFLVQKYISSGHEIIIGARAEPGLGHIVMFGLGGILVELLKDVAFELTPITDREAENLVSSIKAFPVIKGYRGKPGVDMSKIIEMILRISHLVSDHPYIKELDLNPLIVGEDFITTVDARIII